MPEAKNPQLEMAKQPQIKRRVQVNMSLFHFLSLTVETRGLRKPLKSQWIGKITTQQTKTSKVNTVSCILLNILASIYRFESFT